MITVRGKKGTNFLIVFIKDVFWKYKLVQILKHFCVIHKGIALFFFFFLSLPLFLWVLDVYVEKIKIKSIKILYSLYSKNP